MSYVPGGYGASAANQSVFNLKKPMDRKGQADWHYKQDAIAEFAEDLVAFLSRLPVLRFKMAIVPMPTSKCRSDPLYDDRLVKVCEVASGISGIPLVDCLEARASVTPSHMGGMRSVEGIKSNLQISDPEALQRFEVCLLVDDVLTTGAHYAACRDLLLEGPVDLVVLAAFWAKWEPIDDDGFVYGHGPF